MNIVEIYFKLSLINLILYNYGHEMEGKTSFMERQMIP